MDADDISKLVELTDSLVYEKTGQHLETVEKHILQQTLTGKKLNAIQFPSYEDSYVQRFRAPRLWNLLSLVAGEKVHKKTVLEVLQRIQSQRYVPPEHAIPSGKAPLTRSPSGAATQSQLIANAQAKNGHAALNGSVSCPGLKDGETTSEEPDSVAPHQLTPAQAGVSYCINPDCIDRQNPNHLNSCQECGTPLLINGQLRELSEAEHFESKKVEDCSPDFTAETSQTDNPDETKSSTYGLPTFMNFMKPGVPLLLSLGVLGCLFVLSWVANWYGVTNHLAGQLPKTQFSYRWALKLNPLSAAAHYNQAAIYEDQYNYQRAHAEYQLAIEGGLIEAYNNQARLYILAGNSDAAVYLLRIGLELAKDTRVRADMYKNQGWARLEQGRYDEAKLDLTEAIKLKSNRAPAYCLLAQVLEHEGDKKGALSKWENCLGFAYQPNTPEEDKWVHLARQRLDTE
jgi:tetratricopeptide (TPR) repeat protein